MTLDAWITLGGAVCGPAFIALLLKLFFGAQNRRLSRIEARMDCFEQAQHACQLSNAREYATKEDTSKIWDRVDQHETRISRLEK